MKRMVKAVVMGSLVTVLSAGVVGCGISPVPASTPQEEKNTTTNTTADAKQQELTTGDAMESYVATEAPADGGFYAMDDTVFNTEEYASVEESGYVSTTTTPLSTVSADVDTASYANIRRMLREGYTVPNDKDKSSTSTSDKKTGEDEPPYDYYDYYDYAYNVIPSGAVRIEEMLNYFDYDYDVPEGNEGFATTVRIGDCPWNADTKLMVLGFATPHEDATVADKGSNLVFLIDVSGSMDDPDKLPLLQSAFGRLVEKLGPNDRVSIVTYSGEEEVVLDGESGSNHQQIMKAIRGLEADGSTNGEAGLRMAYEIAEKNRIEGGVNRIVMASDGDLNVGMTSESDLHDFVEKKRESGVYLSVLGFGAGNYKDTKMETLADHGNGLYHYIDSEDEAVRVLSDRLMANLVPFANDVKVQVEFNPAQLKGYRLIGYENRTMAAEDFKDDTKDAGEVGPESQFTVVYEVVPMDSALEIPVPDLKYGQNAETDTSQEWLTAKLRYKPISGGETKEVERVVTSQDLTADPGTDWRFAAAVSEFGMLLRNSEYKGTSTYDSIRSLVGTTDNAQRKEFLELVDLAEHNK